MDCFLPSEEDTSINIVFPDKQEPLKVDAVDIEILARAVQAMNIPEDSSFGEELARLFKKKYSRTITRAAAIHLWNAAHQLMEETQKKLYLGPELSNTSEEEETSQAES